MPTYQYACRSCGHEFEAVQSFSDASLTACPVCGGELRKVYSAVGVVFKGSGFYRNDSRSGPVETPAGSKDAPKDGATKDGAAAAPAAKGADAAPTSTPAASSSSSSSVKGGSSPSAA